MPHAAHITRVTVDLDALRHNFSILQELRREAQGPLPAPAPGVHFPPVMPVVKADAYGHGHIEAGLALCRAGATALASGSIQEAVLLRSGLTAHGVYPEIVSLLGPVGQDDWALAAGHALIPMLHSMAQLEMLESGADSLAPPSKSLFPARGDRPLLPVAVKCNSGMSRLGFGEGDLPELLRRIDALPEKLGVAPVLAISHLASADGPDGQSQVERQARIFAPMVEIVRSRWPVAASLGNSAGTLLGAYADPIIGPQVCRPGLALYGCNPLAGTPHATAGTALKPVMSVHTPVIALRTLSPGESIGYGHTWTAERETVVGIIAAGYADGFSRGFSNKGQVFLGGARVDVIGRVSMQMTALDLGAAGIGVRPGDPVYILGGTGEGAVSAEDLAACWGTITYEALCLLGMNNRRYTGG